MRPHILVVVTPGHTHALGGALLWPWRRARRLWRRLGPVGVAVANGLAYRPNVGFWDRQINELLTGIGELLGGGGGPLQPAAPAPGPSPGPDPTPLSPYPGLDRQPPVPKGPWPPYLPDADMDLTEGMPRSTLDKLHDEDPDYVIWKPRFPGDLPPYWMHDYKPVGPTDPDTWVKRGPGDFVRGETYPAGFTGRGADEAGSADASLKRSTRALAHTDQQLDQSVSGTHAAHVRTHQRLVGLHHEIRGGVARLQPWLDSPAGQAQLAAFLSTKTQQVQAVIREATAASESHAAAVRGLAETYGQIRTTRI